MWASIPSGVIAFEAWLEFVFRLRREKSEPDWQQKKSENNKRRFHPSSVAAL
jgi:hypothetical protein